MRGIDVGGLSYLKREGASFLNPSPIFSRAKVMTANLGGVYICIYIYIWLHPGSDVGGKGPFVMKNCPKSTLNSDTPNFDTP